MERRTNRDRQDERGEAVIKLQTQREGWRDGGLQSEEDKMDLREYFMMDGGTEGRIQEEGCVQAADTDWSSGTERY